MLFAHTCTYLLDMTKPTMWLCAMTKPTMWLCAQRRLRSAWASAQSDQSLRGHMKKAWVLSYPLSAQRRLIRLGGCPGWYESSLGAQSLCWFCHVAAHIITVSFVLLYVSLTLFAFFNTFKIYQSVKICIKSLVCLFSWSRTHFQTCVIWLYG